MSKHTPGPWEANISEMEAYSARVQVRTANGGYLICSDAGYQNAPVIAAAPAMYTDGKLLCELVRDFMNENRLYDGQVIQAIKNLETALAQAEGR